jgi:hypothetical protein
MSGIFTITYFIPEHDDQNNSVTGLVNNEGPPIRKIFVGNLSDRVSSIVNNFLL